MVHLFHFLGDQTKLRRLFGIVLVEGHWLERQERFAGLVHRFNIVLEASRRGSGAQLSRGIDSHSKGGGGINRRPVDVVDIAAIANVCTRTPDSNNIVGRGDRTPRSDAQSDVVAAGGVGVERTVADGCVAGAGRVASKRLITVSRVGAADCVVSERFKTVGSVGRACGVAKKRPSASSRISEAAGVARERGIAVGRVVIAWYC